MQQEKTIRVPVISKKGIPLMPTTSSRARKWMESGKAKGFRNRVGIFCLQLTQEPSGYATQEVIAGSDKGKAFTGLAFQTKLATIACFHLCLPGFTKNSKNAKRYNLQAVTSKMSKRSELRKTRRGQRINRKVPFKKRNHRQVRFDNRKKEKLAPSIKANRQMELRVLFEMSKVLPIYQIRDEESGGKITKNNGFGLSPMMVGENWFRSEAGKIAPVIEVNSLDTARYRNYLGLTKDKKDKSKQTRETHANDAIAISASYFVSYEKYQTSNSHGHQWKGECVNTDCPFVVITRPQLFRRKLHQENYSKGGVLKRQGGTVTPFGFRSGDYVEAVKKGKKVRGWIGGYSNTEKTKVLSVYDHNWKRIGQYAVKNVRLIERSSRLCVA